MVPLFELFAFRHRDSRTESRFALGRAGRGRSSCDTRNEISGARRSAASTWSRATSLRTRHRWMQHCYNEQPLELEPAIDAAEAFLLSVFSGGTLPAAAGAAGRRHERSGSPIGGIMKIRRHLQSAVGGCAAFKVFKLEGNRLVGDDRELQDFVKSNSLTHQQELTSVLADPETVDLGDKTAVRKSARCPRVVRAFNVEPSRPAMLPRVEPRLTKRNGEFRILNCALLFGACIAYAAMSNAQEIERASWSIGDTWTYKHIDLAAHWDGDGRFPSTRKFTVSAVRPGTYQVDVSTVEEYGARATTNAVWSISRNLNYYYRESATLPRTELKFLKWPLVIGESWDFTHPLSDGTTFQWHVKVAGWDDVTVPAGSFKAIVVKVEGSSGAHYRQDRTLWYSPDAKALVKHELRWYWRGHAGMGVVDELLTFSVAGAGPSK